ncbi:MAG: sigma-54-dependent transcriptional regulator, partial [Planctomycetota bacterium]
MRGTDGKGTILVVDDTATTLRILKRRLESKGYSVLTARSVNQAIELIDANPIDLVITDLRMPRVGGLDLVRYARENVRDMEVIVITGYPSIESAVKAVNLGAREYLAKPFTDKELLAAVKKALGKVRMRQAQREEVPEASLSEYGLIGQSRVMKKVFRTIAKAAATRETVLVAGESGTGKELVARATHYGNVRSWSSFVPVNCGAIPDGLLESELFGYVKGAFTGATESRAGFFQTAEGGTIFLDEVSETTLSMQVKLLRVLQDKEVYMIGSSRGRKVNVRIIASTNKDLRRLVGKGLFREDLFFRLNVITIDLPPLRERG